jgi:hypothetical protein
MPSKRNRFTPFPLWQTNKLNGKEERFIRLGNSFLLSKQFNQLSYQAQIVYIHMMLESAGQKRFIFPKIKYIPFIPHHTFLKAKKELIENGFIEIIQNNRNLRKPNQYSFTEKWKSKNNLAVYDRDKIKS